MYEYRAKITNIVDGDTVDMDIDLGFDVVLSNQRVRLNGVDTPEKRTSDPVEKVFGYVATNFVSAALPVGSWITVRTSLDDRGKFGRILGEIILNDGTNLNEALIQKHYAVHYHGQAKADVEAEHLANRKILIESGEVILPENLR